MSKLSFVFFGTPDVASRTLEILKQAGYLPSLVVTSPDKPQGRKMIITPPPVKVWAEENKIPFIQPASTGELLSLLSSRGSLEPGRSDEKMGEVKPDLFIVVAYGRILPEELLNIPRRGSINIHYSLLPKYRGASPVESAILNGDTITGVTIQKMVYEVDAGDILAQKKISILPDETAPELRERLIQEGGKLLVEILPKIEELKPVAQDNSLATHAGKIKKEDGLIDPGGNAQENYNKFRAYAYWPRTYFFRDNKRIIVTRARLENGPEGKQFVIEKIIPEGGKETDYKY